MQSTLLGIAIVLIVALVAALVGPFFIDWNQYRGTFEREASRLAGIDVRVRGPLDVRLLPSPSMTLQGVEIGRAGEEKLKARSLSVEFSLGSLVRGEWRAAHMRVAGAELHLGLGSSGEIDWPPASIGFDADALSIERLNVEDARAVLTDLGSGSRTVLENLWFQGDLRSLVGPMKGEGAFTLGGDLYGYRLIAGRVGEDGGIRVKLGLDPSDRPLSIEADGTLWAERAQPRFEGSLVLARPVGVALASGETRMNEPWRLTSRVKVTPASALLEQIDFQRGPDERAIKLSGTAELTFGARPHLEGVLSARTLDLDRTLLSQEPGKRLPAQALQQLVDLFSGTLRPTMPVQVGLSVETVTVGGAAVQSVRGDVKIDASGWDLERFEMRAPGFTQVNLSGRFDPQTLAFTGPARIDSRDPKALLAWIEGRSGSDGTPAQARPMRIQGDVTLGGETLAVERLRAEFDRESVEGRLLYGRARGDRAARLEAELKAAELDLDAVLTFGKAALAGTGLERPREISLALDIGRASIGGYTARTAAAKLRYDGTGLQLDRLSVADLGGAAFSASGHVDMTLPAPRGNLAVDLDARELGGVTALVAAFAPQAAERLRREAARLAPAKLQAKLTIDGTGLLASTAKLTVDGRLGAMRVALAGDATGDLLAPDAATLRLDSRLDSDNGVVLIELLGLDKMIAVERRPARLTLAASGPLGGQLRLDGKLAGAGIDASVGGTVQLGDVRMPGAALQVAVISADARPLQAGSGRAGLPLPIAFTGKATLAGSKVTFDDLSGTINGATARGRLAVDTAGPIRVDGAVELDSVDALALVGAGIGMPAARTAANGNTAAWPTEPFGAGLFAAAVGRVEFRATRMVVGPTITARQVRGSLRLAPAELALEDVEGSVGGGKLSGQLTVRRNAGGLAAQGRIGLSGADAAAVLSVDGRPPVSGKLALNLDIDGAGLSPASLFGSLAGTGMVTLEGAQLTALDPRAFELAMRAADQGLTIDTQRVRGIVSAGLESGRLTVPQLDAAIGINAGQVRLANTIARADGADLTLSGSFDLSEWLLDARLTLSGSKLSGPAGAGRPDVFIGLRGAPLAPQRNVDVAALVGWLTLRAIDQQAKRLEALEEARRLEVIEEARKLRAQEEAKRLEAIEQAKRQDAADLAKRLQAEQAKREEEAGHAEAPAADGTPPHTATAPAEPRPRATPPSTPLRQPRASKPGEEGKPTAAVGPAGAQAPTLPPPIDIRPVPVPSEPRASRPRETGVTGQQRPQPRSEERAPARSVFDSLLGPNN